MKAPNYEIFVLTEIYGNFYDLIEFPKSIFSFIYFICFTIAYDLCEKDTSDQEFIIYIANCLL